MENKRDRFTFFASFESKINRKTDAEKLMLFDAIIRLGLRDEVVELPENLMDAYEHIQEMLGYSNDKRDNATKGGAREKFIPPEEYKSCVDKGMGFAAIAKHFGVSENTVRSRAKRFNWPVPQKLKNLNSIDTEIEDESINKNKGKETAEKPSPSPEIKIASKETVAKYAAEINEKLSQFTPTDPDKAAQIKAQKIAALKAIREGAEVSEA